MPSWATTAAWSAPARPKGNLLWSPDPARTAQTQVARFMRAVAAQHGLSLSTYDDLWRWSVADLDGFWAAVWSFFDVQSDRPCERVLESRTMPGAIWFRGSKVNYAEHVLRHGADAAVGETALVHSSELRAAAELSWQQLGAAVRVAATQLRALGVQPGDRVVAYMPNIPETVIAMLATTAIGAVWSSAAPEFGARTVIDRFAQIAPKLIFVADGYRFGGKDFDRAAEIRTILAELPSVEHVVWLPYLEPSASPPVDGAIPWNVLMDTRRSTRARSPTPGSSTTIRSGCCSRRGRRACRRQSCTVTSARCSNTSRAPGSAKT